MQVTLCSEIIELDLSAYYLHIFFIFFLMQFIFKDITSIKSKEHPVSSFQWNLGLCIKKREIADVRGLIIHFKFINLSF